ncbi:MAG: hypothetical protein ACI8ZM_002469 [Crocinitomix sp.]|jgi:hypothetical protein
MSFITLLITGGAAAGIYLGTRPKKDKSDDDRWTEEPLTIPTVIDVPKIPNQIITPVVPKPPIAPPVKVPVKSAAKEFRGKYSYTVQVDKTKIGNFNSAGIMKSFYEAVRTANLVNIRKIAGSLNIDRTRQIHNDFLEYSKGRQSLYQFVLASKLSNDAKKYAVQFLASAGVSGTLVKNRRAL